MPRRPQHAQKVDEAAGVCPPITSLAPRMNNSTQLVFLPRAKDQATLTASHSRASLKNTFSSQWVHTGRPRFSYPDLSQGPKRALLRDSDHGQSTGLTGPLLCPDTATTRNTPYMLCTCPRTCTRYMQPHFALGARPMTVCVPAWTGDHCLIRQSTHMRVGEHHPPVFCAKYLCGQQDLHQTRPLHLSETCPTNRGRIAARVSSLMSPTFSPWLLLLP